MWCTEANKSYKPKIRHRSRYVKANVKVMVYSLTSTPKPSTLGPRVKHCHALHMPILWQKQQ